MTSEQGKGDKVVKTPGTTRWSHAMQVRTGPFDHLVPSHMTGKRNSFVPHWLPGYTPLK